MKKPLNNINLRIKGLLSLFLSKNPQQMLWVLFLKIFPLANARKQKEA